MNEAQREGIRRDLEERTEAEKELARAVIRRAREVKEKR
jgi:hypothetical protein